MKKKGDTSHSTDSEVQEFAVNTERINKDYLYETFVVIFKKF